MKNWPEAMKHKQKILFGVVPCDPVQCCWWCWSSSEGLSLVLGCSREAGLPAPSEGSGFRLFTTSWAFGGHWFSGLAGPRNELGGR